MSLSKHLAREKQTVALMVNIYCRAHHGSSKHHLCPDCTALLDYAHRRIERCPFGEKKHTCQKCPIHCYKPQMRDKMRQVMRYAGPRMLLYAPMAALRHLLKNK